VAAAPLISVVIATRNAARDLPRCLDSLRGQTFRDFEVIVMDGGSTDATARILEAAGDVVGTWRSEPDNGIYSAWNKALALARGEWICFLGADDWFWDENALAQLAPQLRAAPARCRVVYSRLRQIDAGGRVAAELGEPWKQAGPRFRSHVCLPQPGLMHRRSLFEAHGRFDESFQLAGDYELLLRELKSGDALFVPALTVGMELGGRTTSPEHFLQLQREARRALNMHGLAPPRLISAYWIASAWLYRGLHSLLGERAARRLADVYRRLTFRDARYSVSRENPDQGRGA
jgi:glycosyltransferase involved in cell wall biosynthesis